jgi:hypothetical protein
MPRPTAAAFMSLVARQMITSLESLLNIAAKPFTLLLGDKLLSLKLHGSRAPWSLLCKVQQMMSGCKLNRALQAAPTFLVHRLVSQHDGSAIILVAQLHHSSCIWEC